MSFNIVTCTIQYLCYFSQVSLLLLRPHSIIPFSFNSTVQLPHTHFPLLPFVTLLYRIFYIQTHNPITSILQSIPFTSLISLRSSISANPLAAQFGVPIDFLQNLLWILSYSFHAPLNPHTSIPYVIFDSHTIPCIFSNISTFIWGLPIHLCL
jgi:hypothetical protein